MGQVEIVRVVHTTSTLRFIDTLSYASKVLVRPNRQESLKVDTLHKLRSIRYLPPLPPNLYQVWPQGAKTQ